MSITVIIDGKDEKWYLETIKEHYPNMTMKKATIKPDLSQKKSVEELFSLAEQKLSKESSQVVLISKSLFASFLSSVIISITVAANT